jgi:predicted exporter
MIKHGSTTVLLWLLGMAASIAVISQTPFTTDMSAFLPSSPEPAQRVLVDQLRDGVASRLILIGVEGAESAVRAGISRLVVRNLRERGDFALVDNGEGGIGKADQAYVWHNRYLLSPAVTPARFSEAGLRQGLEQDMQLLSSGLEPLLKGSIAHDPTGEMLGLVPTLAGDAHRQLRDGVWTSPDGARALILAQTRAPGFDIDAQEKALTEIRQAFAQAQHAVSGESTRLLASGPGIFGVETRAEMKHDISLYSAIAVVTIVGLLLAVYRSPLVLALTLAPVATGALAGLAAVSLWFGFVHGITIGFGVTLIGEAVDYAIYLFAQTGRQGGAQATLERIWPTLRLGVLVSICGFAAMLFSSFAGFVQLGVFTIVGLAVALGVTRFVLPNLLPSGFAGIKEVGFAPALLRLVHRAGRLRLPLFLVAAAAVALIASRSDDLWQDELSSMSPISAADQRLDRDLRRDIGAPDVRYIAIATASDQETLLETCERMTAHLRELVADGALSGYESPDRYLPSEKMQQARKAALPDRKSLEQNLTRALDGLPFRPDTFIPFLDEVSTARDAPPLSRRSLDDTALSLKLDSLLIDQQGQWVAVMPLHDVANPQQIADALEGVDGGAGVTVKLLDLKTESDHLLHGYRHEALLLASLGSIVIAALLLGHFRSIRQSIVILAPLGLAVIGTVAMLTFDHHRLSIFNLFGLLLVVAVGSNYCLFFQRGGMIGEEGARMATSLLLANTCTVIGFGALALSHIPVLYGIGSTVAIGTALSLVAAAILTPGLDTAQHEAHQARVAGRS